MINKWLRPQQLQQKKLTNAAMVVKTLLAGLAQRSKKLKRNFSWLIKASMQKKS